MHEHKYFSTKVTWFELLALKPLKKVHNYNANFLTQSMLIVSHFWLLCRD